MKTEEDPIHFLKSAQLRTRKMCFVRHVQIGKFQKWKIFTSEADHQNYITTPLFGVLIGLVCLRESMTRRQLTGVIFCTLGTVLVLAGQ